MIKICQPTDCCGCGACVQKCPRQCVTMTRNEEGFFYPFVDDTRCIDCHMCEKVCPFINVGREIYPQKTYAFKHPNDIIRKKSSSGGVFSILAEAVLSNSGVVFGAMFDENWNVKHGFIENYDDIDILRGSKYVQSDIGNSYVQAEHFLKENRYVLFTGTPCQIRGLKLFLNKEYLNLYTLDFVCHGVPSPNVWSRYLNYCKVKCGINTNNEINNIYFRNKVLGWSKYSFCIDTEKICFSESLFKNSYLRGFVHNIYLRQSCNNCKVKAFKSGSDWTCADTWGGKELYPDYIDDSGCSTLMVNSDKGASFLMRLPYSFKDIDFEKIAQYNKSIFESVKKHRFHDMFYRYYKNISFGFLVELIMGINKILRVLHL